jgi:Na+-driven multidrug efflux pump
VFFISGEPAFTNKQMIFAILALAIPAVVDNFFQTILGFVDTYFVAQIGLEDWLIRYLQCILQYLCLWEYQ